MREGEGERQREERMSDMCNAMRVYVCCRLVLNDCIVFASVVPVVVWVVACRLTFVSCASPIARGRRGAPQYERDASHWKRREKRGTGTINGEGGSSPTHSDCSAADGRFHVPLGVVSDFSIFCSVMYLVIPAMEIAVIPARTAKPPNPFFGK